MSVKYRVAVLTTGALLAIAPAAMASGSGSGNTTTTKGTSTTAGGAASGNPSGGGATGTAPTVAGAGGGAGGGGNATSGNNNAAPPKTCTISSFTNTPGIYQSTGPVPPGIVGTPDITTSLVIPAGCPGHTDWSLAYTDELTGQTVYTTFGSTGAVASGNANAVTPGTSATIDLAGLESATPYDVQLAITTSLGDVLATADQTVVTLAQS
jgi:hypothetical protein